MKIPNKANLKNLERQGAPIRAHPGYSGYLIAGSASIFPRHPPVQKQKHLQTCCQTIHFFELNYLRRNNAKRRDQSALRSYLRDYLPTSRFLNAKPPSRPQVPSSILASLALTREQSQTVTPHPVHPPYLHGSQPRDPYCQTSLHQKILIDQVLIFIIYLRELLSVVIRVIENIFPIGGKVIRVRPLRRYLRQG